MAKAQKLSPRPTSRPRAGPAKTSSGPGYCGQSPLAMVAYGPPGVGKTAWAAHFPGVAFIHDPQEPGIKDLVEYGTAPEPEFIEEVDSWKQTLKVTEQVASGKLKCQTLVYDSVTGFEKLCFVDHCERLFEGDWSDKGFFAFQKGPKNAAKTDWPNFIDCLIACMQSGVNIVLLAHSQVKTYNNPDGPDYDRYTPVMDKETWQVTARWAKAILFFNYTVSLEKKGIGKAKAKGDVGRMIFTEHAAAYDAKNRYNLPMTIDAGMSGKEAYDNFEAAFRRGIRK